jgi:uncharacterized peroxidase-related enzyme
VCGGDDELVGEIKSDWRKAPLNEADRAMLEYAEKLTCMPSKMTKADLDRLRHHFSEEQVYDIVVIVSFFNFMDRAADAFGVELDPALSRRARSSPDGEALTEVAAARRS